MYFNIIFQVNHGELDEFQNKIIDIVNKSQENISEVAYVEFSEKEFDDVKFITLQPPKKKRKQT